MRTPLEVQRAANDVRSTFPLAPSTFIQDQGFLRGKPHGDTVPVLGLVPQVTTRYVVLRLGLSATLCIPGGNLLPGDLGDLGAVECFLPSHTVTLRRNTPEGNGQIVLETCWGAWTRTKNN